MNPEWATRQYGFDMIYDLRTDERTGERFLAVPVRGEDLLRNPHLNKGLAFSSDERDALGLRGLLPHHVVPIETQLERIRNQFEQETTDIGRHVYLNALMDRNETLFHRFVLENLAETVPIVYTPTVAQACSHWSRIYRRQRGAYITPDDRGHIEQILRARPVLEPPVVVVTDNERILGIGDQGAGGMGIPIGKLALYTAAAGINPARCLPVSLDVGTDNAELLHDELYVGYRSTRLRGGEYDDLVDEFVEAVATVFPGALLQWEDFANRTSFRHLTTHRHRIASFNDDIQGTAAMVVAGLISAHRHLGHSFSDQRIVIAGAGSAGHGIFQQVVHAMVVAGADPARARAQVYVLDSRGLIVSGAHTGMKEEMQTGVEEVGSWGDVDDPPTLLDVVRNVRPNVLIGVTGQAGLFTEGVVREMGAHVEHPILLPLSNPTSHTEVVPSAALDWTAGRARIATGSPFAPVEFDGRSHRIGQANNAFVFPGIGLGVIAVRAREVTDGMFLAASMALADATPSVLVDDGQLYPDIDDLPSVARIVARAVAAQAIEDGVADPVPDVDAAVEAERWEPSYLPMRPA